MLPRFCPTYLAVPVILALMVATITLQPPPLAPVRAAPLPQVTAPPDVEGAAVQAPNIVGGEEAQPGAWPWMASLVVANLADARAGHFCGGVLIDPQWVLTAAHCTFRSNGQPLVPANIDVILGRHQLSSNEGSRIAVAQIVRHPNYLAPGFDYDIALLRLSSASSQPVIRLLRGNQPWLEMGDVPATVTGWGLTVPGDDSSGSDVLRQVVVPLVTYRTCTLSYGILTGLLSPRMLCAGYRAGGRDSCNGDSGGPLMVFDSANSEWVQAGVVSWGDGCAQPYYYGVYSRVSEFAGWIDAQLPGLPQPAPTPTPTPTATPTATIAPTVPAAPTREGYLPLVAYQTFVPLANGGFEQSGASGWRTYTLRMPKLIWSQNEAAINVAPRSGSYLAWLGGMNDEVAVIEQVVTVPPEAPVLTFWYQSYSTDRCGRDYGGVVVNDNIVQRLNLCQAANVLAWRMSAVDLSAYAGETIVLQLRAETNASETSSFFVDDVAWQGAVGSDLAALN